MGLFGSRKKTHVASVVYNLAGDEKDRPDYLKTTVVGSVVHNTPSVSETIRDSYLDGPGIRFRNFARWARRTGYDDAVGLVTGTLYTGDSIDTEVLKDLLPSTPGSEISLQSAETGDADYSYWADKFVADNYPDLLGSDYSSDFNERENKITIYWEDETTTDFIPEGFHVFSKYLYASYVESTEDGWSPVKVFIYEYGTGSPELDSMFSPSVSMGQFFPFIPFRLDNEFISPTFLPEVYDQSKKAYKKALTGKYDKTIEDLEENESLDDIDYAYVTFGVSFNVKEKACKKYIYRFFKTILDNQNLPGSPQYSEWQAQFSEARESWDTWIQWREAQRDPENPDYGTPEPDRLAYPGMPTSSIRVWSGNNPVMNFDMSISWSSIVEEAGSGQYKPDAKRDELEIVLGGSEVYDQLFWTESESGGGPTTGAVIDNDVVTIFWQETPNSWRRLKITGLKHRNLVYGGKAVEISAKEALEDPDESGFIIPLHEGIYREMGLIDGTQMATACAFMVFNCYQVVKKKWYQTGVFKVILIAVVIVVSVYMPGGISAGSGILGSSATVGAALGFTGSLAIVVGAVANAMAAMLLTKAITTGAIALFGDKWGAIIGAVASVIALQVGTSLMKGQTLSSSFANMMRADNILTLTKAAGDGYAGYINASTQEILQETLDVQERYKDEAQKLQELWAENIGYNRGIIDPLDLTEVFGVTTESVDSFLQRTLMTGSDVAELSLEMLTRFVEMTLSTELTV